MRQVAITCRRGTSVVRNLKFLTPSFVFVTDFINWIVQILRRELVQLRISAQEAGLMDPVELWDEG